ncbi:signal peptidase I [Candidatus Bathyarchaeota archaeon]|nr:signal peptidase I [Candidatus Bathyarchaeota archaeon]
MTDSRETVSEIKKFVKKNRSKIELIGLIVFIYLTPQVLWFGLQFTLNTEYPFATVEGESMLPTYVEGDLILTQGINDEGELSVGEVIIFRRPGNWDFVIIHRIINKEYYETEEQWYFQTKGDNNATPDRFSTTYKGWVPDSHIIGRVITKIPYLGLIFMTMQTKIGPFTLSIILQVVIIALILIVYLKEEKETPHDNPL